jgi:hypothetical protein
MEGPDGQRRTVIQSLHKFGLMCNADDTNAAFSPDAIAGIADFSPDGLSTSAVALVEMKSKCSQATLAEEMELIALYREYQEINAEEDPMSFKSSIPDTSYRCQLLHGMASGGLNDAMYVVASLRKIIRVVCVRISSQIQGQYMSAIANLGRQHLGWIVDGGVVPKIVLPVLHDPRRAHRRSRKRRFTRSWVSQFHSGDFNLSVLKLLSSQPLGQLSLGQSQEEGLRAGKGKALPFPRPELGLVTVKGKGPDRRTKRRLLVLFHCNNLTDHFKTC